MKGMLGAAAVVGALGVWAGVRAAMPPASTALQIQAWVTILIACNGFFCAWLWYRAPAGSGDALGTQCMTMLSGSMLLGILPRQFWPDAQSLQVACSIGSVAVTAVTVVMQVRRLRALRRSARRV